MVYIYSFTTTTKLFKAIFYVSGMFCEIWIYILIYRLRPHITRKV